MHSNYHNTAVYFDVNCWWVSYSKKKRLLALLGKKNCAVFDDATALLVLISAPATFNMWLTVALEKMERSLLTHMIIANFVKKKKRKSTACWVVKLTIKIKMIYSSLSISISIKPLTWFWALHSLHSAPSPSDYTVVELWSEEIRGDTCGWEGKTVFV